MPSAHSGDPFIRQGAAPARVRAALAKGGFVLLALLMPIAPAAFGQALPAAEAAPISTGFALPRAAGSLQYAVSASESLISGYYGNSGVDSATNLTGDIAYIASSKTDPFSMIFSGGHGWSTSGQPSYSYLNLALSQVLTAGRWSFVLVDSVSYLPETPSTGLSGVPGVGDLGVDPNAPGENPGQGVLTNYSTRLVNTSSGSVQRQLTGKTSLLGSGSYSLTRFVGDSSNNGLDGDMETGSLGLSHRINARNTFSGNYVYSNYVYGIDQAGFGSQTASLAYTHQFTRKLGVSLSAGPQLTSSDAAGSTQALSLYANVSASYAGRFSNASLAYVRSSNSGFGVVVGALYDSVLFSARRTFARVWTGAVTSSYTQSTSLPSAGAIPFSFYTTVAGVQLSRALVRSLSAYASYTLENQSNRGVGTAVNVYNGSSQVAGFGLTYSPTSIHLGRQ